MKIAYDHQIFGWQRYGGISRYFFELAHRLSESAAAEVKVVSPLHVNEYLRASDIPVDGIHVPQIRRTGRIYRELNRWIAPRMMNLFRPDLVHETYYSHGTMAPCNSRIVLTVFDMIHELFPDNFSSWDSTRQEKEISVKRADHIICISENTRQDLIRLLGVPLEKTTVVHLGFSLTSSKLAFMPSIEKPYLLFVGSRGGYKNFDSLLNVYASNRNLRDSFDLVAFGGGGFSSRELALIRRYGLKETEVRQISGGDDVLASLYTHASLFVYPSLYEGFGIPPLEAMSYDCPVVCSRTSSIPEVVGNAAVMFDPHSVESIGAAIDLVLGDEPLRRSMRVLGRERVQAFSWSKCALQTLDVYKKVLL